MKLEDEANLQPPTIIRSIRPMERRPIRSMTRMQPSRNIAKCTTKSWQLTATTPKQPSRITATRAQEELAPHCYNTKGAVAKHRDVHNKTLASYCYKDNNINAVVMSDASRSTRRLHRTATIINSSLNPSFLKHNNNPDTQPFDKVNLPTKA